MHSSKIAAEKLHLKSIRRLKRQAVSALRQQQCPRLLVIMVILIQAHEKRAASFPYSAFLLFHSVSEKQMHGL